MFNQAEKLLFELFLKHRATNEAILNCIKDGARITEVIDDSTILLELVDHFFEVEPIDMDSFVFLIDSGANISHIKEDGTCILAEAITLHQDSLTEKLLTKGANPNVIIEYFETILDHAQFDEYYHECEGSEGNQQHLDWAKRMKNITESLLKHGAKNYRDLWTDKLGRWLYLFGCNATGIVTEGGNIEINNLPIDEKLKSKILKWKSEYWDSWKNEYGPKPKTFRREKSNTEGLDIAHQLLLQIPSLPNVRYGYIDVEFENKGIRSVSHQIIK